MYKILFICLISFYFINSISAQELTVPKSIYDEMKKELEDKIEILEKENKRLKDVDKENKKLSEEIEKLKTEKKELTDENTTLTAENKRLTEENTNLTAENKRLTEENTTLTAENKRLTEENTTLKAENKRLTDENTTLKAENKRLTDENTNLTAENKRLTDEDTTLKAENKRLTDEIAALKAEIAALKAEIERLIIQIASLKEEITRLKIEIEAIKQENTTLKSIVSESVSVSVEVLINSQDYSIQKANELILLCEKTRPFFNAQELNLLITKLGQYKILSEAMDEANKILSSAYDKTSSDNAITLLTKVQTFNNNQNDQKSNYISLIKDYCNKTAWCKLEVEDLNVFCPQTPENIPPEIKRILREVNEHYFFLQKELKTKSNNPCYRCNFPNVECN